MDERQTEPAQRHRWLGRGTKLIIAFLLLAWFGRYAYVKLTTLPPTSEQVADLVAGPKPENDATEELVKALAALPPAPPFDEPPPAGMRWLFPNGQAPIIDVSDLNLGSWDPDQRPHLRATVRYLTHPLMVSTLAQLHDLRGRPYEAGSQWTLVARGTNPIVGSAQIREVTRILSARARYRHSALRNVPGAWDDLKTALVLPRAAYPENLLSLLVAVGCEACCLDELLAMSQEVEFSAEVACDIDETLRALPALTDTWAEVIRTEFAIPREIIDTDYTDDGNGNGWLVLSESPSLGNLWPGMGMPATRSRSRLWNLFAPVFNDRKTVHGKLEHRIQELEHVAELPYPAALVAMEKLEGDSQVLGVLDGPVLAAMSSAASSGGSRSIANLFNITARRRAARIMTALNRYHAVHGDYPQSLADLVPDFMTDLPLDPFCDRPFGYKPEGAGGYCLYSWGTDGDDDRGQPGRDGTGQPRPFAYEGDHIYTFPRGEPFYEPQVEPIEAAESAPGGVQP